MQGRKPEPDRPRCLCVDVPAGWSPSCPFHGDPAARLPKHAEDPAPTSATPPAAPRPWGRIRVRSADSLADALGTVLAALPVGWRFNRLFIAHAEGGRNTPGAWYASASGPDPRRPATQFGITTGGQFGVEGAAWALSDLVAKLARLEA